MSLACWPVVRMSALLAGCAIAVGLEPPGRRANAGGGLVGGAYELLQARAAVRIVQGATLRLDGGRNPGAPSAKPALIQLERGTPKVPAKLIEFE